MAKVWEETWNYFQSLKELLQEVSDMLDEIEKKVRGIAQ